jgi:hypothetical protein
MIAALNILLGLVLALVTVFLARRLGPSAATRLYAVGLVVAALVYLALALASRSTPQWVAIELLGVALYGGVAWLGFRGWAAALAPGWAAHVAWDLALHLDGAGAAFTPAWYPWLCVGFDLPIAVAVLTGGRAQEANR